jgi:hypothetical protein
MDETSKTTADAQKPGSQPSAISDQIAADSGQQPSGGEARITSTSDQLSAVSNQRTYTGADVQKLISDTRAEAGRRIKALEQDASTFKAKAETYEAQHAKDLEELGIYRRQSAINEVATKYKVDARLLDKPYLNGLEQWEDLARTLAGIKPVVVQGAPGNIQPDSGVTHGGGTDLSKLTADDLIKRGLEKRKW